MSHYLRLVLLGLVLVVGCSPSGRLLANEPSPLPSVPVPSASPVRPTDPQPVDLLRDESPHDRLTEWWYYTGHLHSEDGRRFGFEFVIFRAERGSFPVSWASHLALTDETGGRFYYDQRSEIGPQVDLDADSSLRNGFIFNIRGTDDTGVPSAAEPWKLLGGFGRDIFEATTEDFAITLIVDDMRDAPILHDGDGWIDFGAAGSSYYYSRPRMTAEGEITLLGETLEVTGMAWFDHQWGDFIAVGGGGWDWFAVNLDDGTDLTLSLVRAADGSYPLVYGTLVRATGEVVHVTRDEFTVTSSSTWTSPHTGATWPALWNIEIPGEELSIELVPTVPDQELDTRATTGVVYWEGSQVVSATHGGEPVGGEGYVELTGYFNP